MCDSGETRDATQFRPEDAPLDERDQYRILWDTNRGYSRGSADTANQTAIARRGRYDSIANRLDLTDFQKAEGQRRLRFLDLQRLGLSLDLVVFCLCALVVREDGRNYHPSRNEENNDDIFVEVAEDLGLRESQIASCWEKLRIG